MEASEAMGAVRLITIDQQSLIAPYEQVRGQLADRIRNGELVIGTRLPTVRQLAADLGLAVNTVARAYRELEHAGLVQSRGRAGTYVHTSDVAKAQVEAAAQSYARVIHATGVTVEEAVQLLRAAANSEAATI
jgi:DNA-binding transcriptional regulator YhcF (GntR family)